MTLPTPAASMRIGIIETGGPPADLAQRFGDYPAMMRTMLGDGFSYRTFDAVGAALPSATDADAFVVTGSPAGVYEGDPWIADLLDWLRRAKGRTKLVGICFGHQAMAQAFGGRVEKSERGWGVGLHRYDIVARPGWIDGDATGFAVPVSHQDQVVMAPPAARIVAASPFTSFAALDYRDGISFQGHPEFAPDYAAALIEARRDRLPDPDAAIASLAQPGDGALVARWTRNFLAG